MYYLKIKNLHFLWMCVKMHFKFINNKLFLIVTMYNILEGGAFSALEN